MGKLIFIVGGTRSGKSAYAEDICKKYPSVAYIATGLATDEEMRQRIQAHKDRRNPKWVTIEAPVNAFEAAIKVKQACALLDSVTTLINNIIFTHCADDNPTSDQIAEIEAAVSVEMDKLITATSAAEADFVIVSDEVGMGMVSMYPLGRVFCDLLGRVNQAFGQASDEAYLIASGLPVKLK